MEDREQGQDSAKTGKKWRAVLASVIVSSIAIALYSLALYSDMTYHCWYGPFARRQVVDLPLGYFTYVSPVESDDRCPVVGDGSLTLSGVANGFVVLQYRRGMSGEHERECPDDAFVVMSLRDWNWVPDNIAHYLRTEREEDLRRAAESAFIRNGSVDPP